MKEFFMYEEPKKVFTNASVKEYLTENELLIGGKVNIEQQALLNIEFDVKSRIQKRLAIGLAEMMYPKLTFKEERDPLWDGLTITGTIYALTEEDIIKLLSHFDVKISNVAPAPIVEPEPFPDSIVNPNPSLIVNPE